MEKKGVGSDERVLGAEEGLENKGRRREWKKETEEGDRRR